MSYEDDGYAEYLENQAQDEEQRWLESESAAAEAEAKNEENEYYELIGKFYELLNLNGSVMARIKINHIRRIHEDGIKNNDESFSPAHSYMPIGQEKELINSIPILKTEPRLKLLEEELARQMREKEWLSVLVEIYSHAVLKFCTNDQYQLVNKEINDAYDQFYKE